MNQNELLFPGDKVKLSETGVSARTPNMIRWIGIVINGDHNEWVKVRWPEAPPGQVWTEPRSYIKKVL